MKAVSSVILRFKIHCEVTLRFSDAAMAALVLAQTLVMVGVFCR